MKRTSAGRAAASRRRAAPADVHPVLEAIARTAARLCEAHDALILQVEGDRLRLVAKHGRLRTARTLGDVFPLSGEWVGGRAAIDRESVHVRDVTRGAGARFAQSLADARATRVRTILATPLLRQGAAVGVILIRRARVQPFTAKQIALLRTFADQAAITLENVRLFKELAASNGELRVALEQQTATSELLKVIGRSTFDLRPVFETLAEQTETLPAPAQA